MTAEECAALMIAAMERRQRLVLTSSQGHLARWLSLLSPATVDRMAARAIREKR
jgi:hypothetical protein